MPVDDFGNLDDHGERRKRTLTDSDVQAIADELERRWSEKVYLNAGKGLVALAKKAAFIIILWLAVEGLTGWHTPLLQSLTSRPAQQ